MTSEGTGWREFTQFVANHILRDINWDMTPAIMDRNRMPNHLGKNGAGSGPGTDDLSTTSCI
jgi:hypothetical protein